MNEIVEIKKDIDELNDLSFKIRKGTATIFDYKRHEELILKHKLASIQEIRESMLQYGFSNYEDYVKAREKPADRQQKKIVNVYVAAGIVAVGLLAIYGLVRYLKKKN